MACKLNYIDTNTELTPEQKATTTAWHTKLMQELLATRAFIDYNGMLHIPSGKDDVARQALVDLLEKYQPFVDGQDLLAGVYTNTTTGRKIVVLNTLGLADVDPDNPSTPTRVFTKQELEDALTAYQVDENLFQTLQTFGEQFQFQNINQTQLDNLQETVTELRKRFKIFYRDMRGKQETSAKFNADLNALKEAMEDSDILVSTIGFINNAGNYMNLLQRRFFAPGGIKEKLKELDTLSAKEKQDLIEQYNEARLFMSFYNDIKDLHDAVLADYQPNYAVGSPEDEWGFYKQTTDILAQQLGQDSDLYKAAEDQLANLMQVTEDRNELRTTFNLTLKAMLGEEEAAEIISAINDKTRLNQTYDTFQNAVVNRAKILSDFQTEITALMTDFLFPYAQRANEEAVKAGQTQYVLTKEKLNALLRMADKDISVTEKLFGATISSKDPVSALVALALYGQLDKAHKQSVDEEFDLLNTLRDTLGASGASNLLGNEQFYGQLFEDITEEFEFEQFNKYTGTFEQVKTRRFKTLINTAEFDQNYKLKWKELNDPEYYQPLLEDFKRLRDVQQVMGFHQQNGLTPKEIEEKIIKMFKASQMAEWLKANAQIDYAVVQQMVEIKRQQVVDGILSQKEFASWMGKHFRMTEANKVRYYTPDGSPVTERMLAEKRDSITYIQAGTGLYTFEGFDGKQYILDTKGSSSFIQPKADVYTNENFKSYLDNNASIRQLYQAIYDQYKKANKQLPPDDQLKWDIIPQVYQQESVWEKAKADESYDGSAGSYLKNLWKHIGKRLSIRADKDSYENKEGDTITLDPVDINGYKKRSVPVKFVQIINPNKLNKNLVESLMQFNAMSNTKSALDEVEAHMDLMLTLLKGDADLNIAERAINKVNSEGKSVKDWLGRELKQEVGKRANERLIEFIQDVMYGESEFQQVWKGISLNKLGNRLGLATAIQSLALNFNSGINNVLIGQINTMGEAVGGKHYSTKDWHWALKEYNKSVKNLVEDVANDDSEKARSMLTQMMVKFDAIQGEYLSPDGRRSFGSITDRLGRDAFFFLQHIGEHWLQSVGMLSLMKGTKITIDGQEHSLFDAYTTDRSGKLVIKPEWENKADWTKLEQDFQLTLRAINKRLHGNYNSFDKGSVQRYWYGKLMLMFRKHLYTGIKTRWSDQRVDYEEATVTEGYYNTFLRKVVEGFKDQTLNPLQKLTGSVATFASFTTGGLLNPTAYNSLTEDELYNIKKAVFEMRIVLAAALLATLIHALGDDDDEEKNGWVLNQLELMAVRIQADLNTYNPLFGMYDLFRMIKTPSVTLNVVMKYISWLQELMTPWDWFDEYDRKTAFAEKGDNKLWVKTLKLLPFIKQIIALLTPEEQLKYFEMAQKTY